MLLENDEIVIRIKSKDMTCKVCGATEPMMLRTLTIADGKGKHNTPWLDTDYRLYFDVPPGWHYVGHMTKEPGYFCKKCYDQYRFEWNKAKTAVHESWVAKVVKAIF